MANLHDSLSSKDQLALQKKQLDHESGTLGKFFGTSRNASLNIAGFTIIALTTAEVVVLSFSPKDLKPLEFWRAISPVLMLLLGYLFGKKPNQ